MGDVPLPALVQFVVRLFQAYRRFDCFTLEVNPLVVTAAGELVAADCKMEIDNNSVFRHPEMGIEVARDFGHEPTELDLIGWGIEEDDLRGSGFLMGMGFDEKSPGYIGYHPIGGGSAMLGMDALSKVGLKVANYADTSGNPVASKIYRVAKAVLSQPGIEGYLLAGFMMANQEQWHHAHAIVKALRETLPSRPGLPCLLLLCGNKEEESLAILREGLADLPGGDRIEIYGRDTSPTRNSSPRRCSRWCEEYQRLPRGGTEEGRTCSPFHERTITVSIDTDKCPECQTKACIAACQTYARGMLELKDGVPSVAHLDQEGVKRGGHRVPGLRV